MKITDFRTVVAGNASGRALVSKTSLSFWGGVNAETGIIEDVHHDLNGQCLTGCMLCIPYDRGSCSSSGVMLEMLRQGTNPAAILCIEAEPVLALGPIIGTEMYGRGFAMRSISEEDFNRLEGCSTISFTDDAIIAE